MNISSEVFKDLSQKVGFRFITITRAIGLPEHKNCDHVIADRLCSGKFIAMYQCSLTIASIKVKLHLMLNMNINLFNYNNNSADDYVQLNSCGC